MKKKPAKPEPVLVCNAELVWDAMWSYESVRRPRRSERTFVLIDDDDNGWMMSKDYSPEKIADRVRGREVTYVPPVHQFSTWLDGYFGRKPILAEVFALTGLSYARRREIESARRTS